jgi:hypothetical protein
MIRSEYNFQIDHTEKLKHYCLKSNVNLVEVFMELKLTYTWIEVSADLTSFAGKRLWTFAMEIVLKVMLEY